MKETFLKTVMEGAGIGRMKAEYLWQIGVRLPAEQHQGEPVACASILVKQVSGKLTATVERFDSRLLPVGCLVDLYKYPVSADPGEVQRCEARLHERAAFEAAYAAEFSEVRGTPYTAADVASMRNGDWYGDRPFLNGQWAGWQARAALERKP